MKKNDSLHYFSAVSTVPYAIPSILPPKISDDTEDKNYTYGTEKLTLGSTEKFVTAEAHSVTAEAKKTDAPDLRKHSSDAARSCAGGEARSFASYERFKRAADIFLSLFGMIVLFPIFLILAAAIRIDSPGRVIYSHTRIGRGGKSFKIYKFRTMVRDAENILLYKFTAEQQKEFERAFKLENDPRVTKIGNFLRKTSLDELPQLWNVLKGDLSLVGPRPVVEHELYKYGGRAEKFLSVPPGLTGYWQVNGRNAITYSQRVDMDMYYIDNRSTWLDIKIVFSTASVVFKRTGQ